MARDREHGIAEARIATVRGFNRFYTRQIGVLRKRFLDSPFSLGEARVLYEIASGRAPTASDVGRALDLDAGYLSRVLRQFEKRGLVQREASASDGRQSHLTLSPRGRKAYAPLERRSQRETGAMLDKLNPADQLRLIEAMTTIQTLLGGKPEAAAPERGYTLRAPKPGDFGWVVKRNAARLDCRDGRRECRLHLPRQGHRQHRPHPAASGRSESARPRPWRQAHRRGDPLRPPRRLQEDHIMDAQRAHHRAPHLSEGRLQADAQREA
jgi:DNA-binding MarR family transcriptional regulator